MSSSQYSIEPEKVEVTAEGTAEEPTKEESPAADAKDADAPEEKKSFFASLCGCMGGSSPPADTDAKDKPVDDEKEEVEETPTTDEKDETPAAVEAS